MVYVLDIVVGQHGLAWFSKPVIVTYQTWKYVSSPQIV